MCGVEPVAAFELEDGGGDDAEPHMPLWTVVRARGPPWRYRAAGLDSNDCVSPWLRILVIDARDPTRRSDSRDLDL
jgi:hypothetical protein